MTNAYTLTSLDEESADRSKKSGFPVVDLTERLGTTAMRAKVWHLSPGSSMINHRQGEQEELYVPLDGPGQLRIDGELVDVPAGSAVRIPPATARHPVNETDDDHTWLIVGAPPVEDDGIYVDDS